MTQKPGTTSGQTMITAMTAIGSPSRFCAVGASRCLTDKDGLSATLLPASWAWVNPAETLVAAVVRTGWLA